VMPAIPLMVTRSVIAGDSQIGLLRPPRRGAHVSCWLHAAGCPIVKTPDTKRHHIDFGDLSL
jgi:hypothetical protein